MYWKWYRLLVNMTCFSFPTSEINDTEFSPRLFFLNEGIPVGITMQRHNFIDIGTLFYKVTDL